MRAGLVQEWASSDDLDYHLNAKEEPELPDYPKDPAFRKRFGPRGVLHCRAAVCTEQCPHVEDWPGHLGVRGGLRPSRNPQT